MNLQEINAGVGGDSPSVAWNKLILNFQSVDSHNHTDGAGARLTTRSFTIDSNLTFNSFSGVDLKSLRFTNQTTEILTNYTLYVENNNLVFRAPTQSIPLTVNGTSIAGAPGNIGGLANTTASVNFALANYSFFSSTNVFARLVTGGVLVGPNDTVNPSNFVSLLADPTSAYDIVLPTLGPVANKILMSADASGNLLWVDGLKSAGVTANQFIFATDVNELDGVTVVAGQLLLGTYGCLCERFSCHRRHKNRPCIWLTEYLQYWHAHNVWLGYWGRVYHCWKYQHARANCYRHGTPLWLCLYIYGLPFYHIQQQCGNFQHEYIVCRGYLNPHR